MGFSTTSFLKKGYVYISSQTHIFRSTRIPQGSITIICFCIWTIKHLTNTLAFKDQWPHDLHDLAERILTFITIYEFFVREGESKPRHSDANF